MAFLIEHSNNEIKTSFNISGSKSESNRLLILKHLFKNIEIENLSDSDDTNILKNILREPPEKIDVHHAGTAMRFLIAFFSTQENKYHEISGSERMHNRPIKILVDALNYLGADISYINKTGFPPIKIIGKKINKFRVSLDSNISSQYISALLLIAPSLKKGLEVYLKGKITSKPYLKMTLALLEKIGVQTSFVNNKITVNPIQSLNPILYKIESDWSSLSYFYSIVALSTNSTLRIGNYYSNSIQGDIKLIEIYKNLGVISSFEKNTLCLKKDKNHKLPKKVILDLNDNPDLAQTIAVSCFGLGLQCDLYGLQTLKIKETDRLLALEKELVKLGGNILITNDSLHLKKSKEFNVNICIDTYEDHRMAMAFAPLGIIKPIIINDPMVVSKSFPTYWKALKKLNFRISEYKRN
ncbi:MAG: 3-phosphoshikimate 1-carboxyvinyltransferase [Flavobacteriaceae bacterium]|nr:3-phosphoshikimate 1-carboxyvinyltransferase [Flavobacteriaceae bacterium]